MKSVGEILRKTREKHHITLEQAFEQTRIDPRYLDALEGNRFSELPSPVATQGFIHTYATFLGLDANAMIALCRRDFRVGEQGTFVPRIAAERAQRRTQIARTLIGGFVLLACIGGGYVGWFRFVRNQAPPLVVLEPAEGSLVKSPVVVRGRTASDAVVDVDSRPVGVTQDGEFATQVELSSGEHVITIITKNRDEAATTKQILITVQE